MSALSNTTRRVLGGAALSAVFLGAGAGLAFADTVNTDSGNTTTDVSAVGGDLTSGDSTGGAGGDGAASGDVTVGDATGDDAGVAGESGDGGAGGAGGAGGDTGNTQTVTAAGRDAYVGNSTYYLNGSSSDAGSDKSHPGTSCDSTCTHPAKKKSDCPEETVSSISSKSSSESVAGDNTPVGAADTGDGSFTLASDNSGLGDEVALGGAISAAALLGAYGVSIARRRVGAHRGA